MLRWRPDRCSHLTVDDHSCMAQSGKRIWRCSLCGIAQPWGPTWSYIGSVECKNCWQPQIDFVVCSDACREELCWYLGLEQYDKERSVYG